MSKNATNWRISIDHISTSTCCIFNSQFQFRFISLRFHLDSWNSRHFSHHEKRFLQQNEMSIKFIIIIWLDANISSLLLLLLLRFCRRRRCFLFPHTFLLLFLFLSSFFWASFPFRTAIERAFSALGTHNAAHRVHTVYTLQHKRQVQICHLRKSVHARSICFFSSNKLNFKRVSADFNLFAHTRASDRDNNESYARDK